MLFLSGQTAKSPPTSYFFYFLASLLAASADVAAAQRPKVKTLKSHKLCRHTITGKSFYGVKGKYQDMGFPTKQINYGKKKG